MWKDTWSSFANPLDNQLYTPLNLGVEQLTVASIIKDDKWDLSQMGYHLPKSIADTILTTFIPNKDGLRDMLKYSLTIGIKFSTNLAYQYLLNNNNTPAITTGSFKWLWKLQCPNKIKYFICIRSHNRLPTISYLSFIGIDVDPLCKHCKNSKTINPTFRECPRVMDFWKKTNLANILEISSYLGMKEWIKKCCK